MSHGLAEFSYRSQPKPLEEQETHLTSDAHDSVLRERARGCLIAGACGDALGAVTEFLSLNEIRSQFGAEGVSSLNHAGSYGVHGAITDDTQMTLFTAEGLLRAHARQSQRGLCDPVSVIHRSYMRWLMTQGVSPAAVDEKSQDGWLFALPQLHARRAPGNTCLTALREVASLGEYADNGSKGCGGVMRVAPIGIYAAAYGHGARWAFELATDACKLTHGHPCGYWSGAALAFLVAELVSGKSLHSALSDTSDALRTHPSMEETRACLERAIALGQSPRDVESDIRDLGEGWVGEEALAIAVYCVMQGETLRDTLMLAANHDGDTDSTAAIAGNIRGAVDGIDAVPSDWKNKVELSDAIERMADDLVNADQAICVGSNYPGW